jgi:predicted patatin/cPLA2 family phospholipase
MRGVNFRGCIAAVLAAAAAASCAAPLRNPVPVEFANQAMALDGQVRQWGDEVPKNANAQIEERWAQSRAAHPRMSRAEVNFLAISGGGSDGAFGAGVLVGWTAAGNRPEFDVVTGVSTGALAAPFAFLGPRYDDALRKVYTSYSTNDLLVARPIRGLLGGSALANNAPLANVIASFVNQTFLQEIAREHNRGRRLLIGTTNLDAQRPVIWDMGRIAASDHPGALDLFRKVLLASAAIPGLFPPVHVNVTADTAREEMHVDGGTSNQVFLLPSQMMLGRQHSAKRRLYIIRNGRLEPQFQVVQARTVAIANRSLSTLIKNQGIGDLVQLYNFARRNGIAYSLISIPSDFPDTSAEPFDTVYMTRLFELGFRTGQSGRSWQKVPPRLPG